MFLRLQFFLGPGQGWWNVWVSVSSFMVLSFPLNPDQYSFRFLLSTLNWMVVSLWVFKVSLLVQIQSLILIQTRFGILHQLTVSVVTVFLA